MKTIEEFLKELNEKFPKKHSYTDMFMFTEGKKYYKVCRSRDGITPNSSYAFIDKANGDLYMSGSWNAPTKHVRGNINDASGLDACDEYGVKRLR